MPSDVPVQPVEPIPPVQPVPVPDPPPAPAVDPPPPSPTEPPAEPADPADPAALADPPAAAKPGRSLQERFERSSAQRRAAEQERDYWRERAMATQASAPQPEPAPAPAAPTRPTREQFQNPDDYDAALVKWAADSAAHTVRQEEQTRETERRAAEAKDAQERTQREEVERLRQGYQDRVAKFKADHPDYDEVTTSDDLPISEVMAGAIVTAENGPELAYYLAENPQEAERIARMTRGTYQGGPNHGRPAPDVPRQMFEMGKLAAKLASPPARAPTAPAPITPLRATNGAAVSKDPNEMSTEEYAQWRKQRAH